MNPFGRTRSESPTTHRLVPGDVVASRELTTIRAERISLPAPAMLTHLQFRRFAACPICNVHLRSLTLRHDEILAAGIREVAVFHSPVETMLPLQGEFPFAAIADPDKELYAEFGVESSPKANLHPKAWTGPLKPQAWSFVARARRAGATLGAHGERITGLPADFLIDSDGEVLATHYGAHANDQWSVDELLRRAEQARPPTNGD